MGVTSSDPVTGPSRRVWVGLALTLPAGPRPALVPRAIGQTAPDDADKRYRRMEAAVAGAKTLAVTFDGTFRGRPKGELVCGVWDRLREEPRSVTSSSVSRTRQSPPGP